MSMIEAGRRAHPPVHRCTVWRWRTKGWCGIKLETVQIAGRTLTTEGALRRFEEAVAEKLRRWEAGEPDPDAAARHEELRQAFYKRREERRRQRLERRACQLREASEGCQARPA